MKKILIISEFFYPCNEIGALRPSKIAAHLLRAGYAVDVLTSYPSEGLYNTENCRVLAIKEQQPTQISSSIPTRATQKSGYLISQLKYAKRTIFSYRAGKAYAKRALALFENGTLRAADYDACLTTFGPVSSVLIGLALKETYHIRNWICDFRDPMVVEAISLFLCPLYRHLQNKACRRADKIVAVSNGYLRRICGNKYADKAYMIPNGYDRSDAAAPSPVEHEQMTFAYVGALYEGKRDLSVLFRALSEWVSEGAVDPQKIKFAYAGTEFSFLLPQAERYGMQDILEDHGKIPRADCLALQQNADLLILSTWNDKREVGVFPGKFLEYMLIGRPIISITTGDLPDSEVTAVMREGQFGVAYERARDAQDYAALKAYIKDAYDAFVATGEIPFSPVPDVLKRYNYTSIMERIEGLLSN